MKNVLNLIFLFFSACILAQELPPVNTFSPEDYQADNQNWSITQTEDRQIFVANNKGLLNYNGESWTLYPSPNESIIRSVHAYKNILYSGCFRDFGSWKKNAKGIYEYTSFVNQFDLDIEEDEQFWKILSYEKYIIFQSLDNIYFYDTELQSIDKIEGNNIIFKLFTIQNQLYFSVPNKGIYQIVNGKAQVVNNSPVFTENLVINMYEFDGQLLVQTDQSGIFTFEDQPKPWGEENIPFIKSLTVYNSIQTKSGNLVLGTISHGVVFVDEDANIKFHINQNKGLTNNTVLSVFEDVDENIWLGLDNGINCINMSLPIRIYSDGSGNVGTVYTSIVHDNILYLGTNQGLFYKPLNDNSNDFKLIENSNGQVWDLFIYDDTLFCAHNNGAFTISDFKLTKVLDTYGIWCFKEIPNQPDLLLLGTYFGISIIEKSENTWKFRNQIEGFNISSKFVEFIKPTEVLINHEYKGVFSLKINDDYTRSLKLQQHEEVEKGLYSSLIQLNASLLYAYEKGVFRYHFDDNQFIKDTVLTNLSYKKDPYSSGKLVPDPHAKSLWSFTSKGINYISPSQLNTDYESIFIPIPSHIRNAMVGYENITKLPDNSFLFGNSQGYFL